MISLLVGLYRVVSRKVGGNCCSIGWSRWECISEDTDEPIVDEYSVIVDYTTQRLLVQSRTCLGCGYTQRSKISRVTTINDDRKEELKVDYDIGVEVEAQLVSDFLEDLYKEIVEDEEAIRRINAAADDDRILVSIPASHLKHLSEICNSINDDDDDDEEEFQ